MRPIKFRAWNSINQSMRYFDLFDYENLKQYELEHPLSNEWSEIMQYTGLLDFKGKEIYEGDIVKTGDETGEVQYDEEQGSYIILFYPNNAKQKSGCAELGSTHPSPIKEIIGQKYELLRM